MKKFIILLILFSVGVMGQVAVTNPYEVGDLTPTNPIYITNPNGVSYIDPCSTTQNACIWDSHSTCIDDGNGQYHCECNAGYKHSDENDNKSACVDICDNSNCSSYGNDVECSSHLIEGQAVCIKKSDTKAQKCIDDPNSSSCGGVLLCSGENLIGVCKVFTESTNNFNYTWYNDSNGNAVRTLPKSAIAINSNWEIYAPKESFFFNPYGLYHFKTGTLYYSNGVNILNFNTSIDNLTKVFVIQPINKIEFKKFYGDNTPYFSVEYRSDYGTTYYRQVFKSEKAFQTEHYLPHFGINYIDKDDNLIAGGFDKLNDYVSLENSDNNITKYLDTIMIYKTEDNISEGLIICGTDYYDNYDCKSIKSMSWNFRDHDYTIGRKDTTSNNWEIFFDNLDTIYLHEGWEAFVCNSVYDNIKDCFPISENITYDRFTAINTSIIKPELLIVQPKTSQKLREVLGDIPYAILYDEPNFHGNHVLIYNIDENIKKYPNPIQNPKSVYNNHKGLNIYLNKGSIVGRKDNLGNVLISLYNKVNDKYINTTDSTPWEIESKTVGKYYTINSVLNEFFGIHSEGVEITFNDVDDYGRNYYKTYQGKYANVGKLSDLKYIKIYSGWEVYFCSDYTKNDCKHYSNAYGNNNSNLIPSLITEFGASAIIKYMKVQPTDDNKMNQFYGHREYNEKGNGFKGYVELYKNKDLTGNREVILNVTDVTIGKDTIFKPNEIKGIRIVGGLKLEINFNATAELSDYYDYIPSGSLNYTKKTYSATFDFVQQIFVDTDVYTVRIDSINSIKFLGKLPSVMVTNTTDIPNTSFGIGLFKYSKAGNTNLVKQYYEVMPNINFHDGILGIDANKTNEDLSQNKNLDNYDFVFSGAHGSWGDNNPSWSMFNDVSGRGTFNASNEYQLYSLGDYETEWLFVGSCQSLGNKACNDCSYGSGSNKLNFHHIYSCKAYQAKCTKLKYDYSLEENVCIRCILNGSVYNDVDICSSKRVCNGYYHTTEPKVFGVYSNIFANGLHGFGGFYKDAYWKSYLSYLGEGEDFWNKVSHNHSIAYAWIHSIGKDDPERNAGYIAPGPCWGYDHGLSTPSYVHDDHFWGYGLGEGATLPDPDKTFIKNEGFCYYAYVKNRNSHYDFSVINKTPSNWIILNETNQDFVTESILTNLASAFKVDKKDIFKGQTMVSYGKEDNKNVLVVDYDVNSSIWDLSIADDNLIYSLKNNADVFYDNNLKIIVEDNNYEILNTNVSFIADRHYDYNGNADNTANVYEVIFTYSLSNANHSFLDENYIKIGVNPITGEILSCKTKIAGIKEDDEVLDYKIIDNDYDDLVKDNGDNYYKAYYKIDGQYRPAIYDMSNPNIEVVKIY